MISALDQRNMVFEAIQNGARIGLLKEDVLLRLLGLMRQLHDANGTVKAISHNHSFIETLKEHNPDSFFRIHSLDFPALLSVNE